METDYWWKKAKIYELYVDKFAGDLNGLTARLDYFTLLGINTLHILPHYPSPMIDDGYDITDYRNVRSELGTIDDMRTLIEAAKKKNIRIILDFVLNHVSAEHPWFVEARSSKESTKRNYFLWSEQGDEFSLALNAFPDIKPRNWIFNAQTGDYYFATFYPEQPDLNWDNEEVVTAMLAHMEFWADMGVGGFRLDAAGFLIKRKDTTCRGLPETHQVIKRIRKHLDKKYPRGVILLGEAAQSIEDTKTYFGDGDECHMMYHFPMMAQLWLALSEGDASCTPEMNNTLPAIPENCQWGVFLRNHDEVELRFLESPTQRESLLRYLDPKGEFLFNKNVATCVRVANVMNGEKEKILTAFRLLYGTHGAPIMYYGDEIGMKNLPMSTYKDVRKYVRGAMDWAEAKWQMAEPTSLLNETAQIIKHAPLAQVNAR